MAGMDLVKARKALLRGLVDQSLEMVGSRRHVFETGLKKDLDAEFLQVTQPDIAVEFAKICPVPGTVADDYRNRIVELAPGKMVIAGIRFENLDPQRPFIQVTASTHPVLEMLEHVEAHCAFEFEGFRPKAIEFFVPGRTALRTKPGGLIPERYLVGASFGDLRKLHPQSSRLAGLNLEPMTDFSYFPKYLDQYKRAMNSTSIPMVVGSQSQFEPSLHAGLMFEARMAGHSIGYIALRRSDFKGVRGLEILDQIVDPKLWGRGLAGAMQIELLHVLEAAKRADYLFGGIQGMNRASLKTAMKLGRQVLGVEFRLLLEHQRKAA